MTTTITKCQIDEQEWFCVLLLFSCNFVSKVAFVVEDECLTNTMIFITVQLNCKEKMFCLLVGNIINEITNSHRHCMCHCNSINGYDGEQ